jgi:CHAD domain-containing protein
MKHADAPRDCLWRFDLRDLRSLKTWLAGCAGSVRMERPPGTSRKCHDLFLDTPDLRVLRAGYALRVRREEGRVTATLCSASPRLEREDSGDPIAQLLDAGNKRSLFDGSGAVTDRLRRICREEELVPLAPVRTDWQAYRVFVSRDRPGGIQVTQVDGPGDPGKDWQDAVSPRTADAVLERSFLTDRLGRSHRLVRLEVRCSPEDAPDIEILVERLREERGPAEAIPSRFRWALEVAGVQVDRAMSLGTVPVHRAMSVGELADAVLRKHVATFLWNEPGTRLGDDPECLHDMRVAARRLRAALKLFRGAYPEGVADRLRQELGDSGRALGEVRDLDVFLAEIGRRRSGLLLVSGAAFDPLRDLLAEEREVARARMTETLDSPPFAALKRDLVGLLQPGPSTDLAESTRPVGRFGARAIRQAHAKMLRLGRRIGETTPPAEYHELRILGKRLRYTLEFLQDVYGSPVKEIIPVLVEVQDVLGLHQDAQVSMEKRRQLAAGKSPAFPPETWVALGELVQVYRAEAARCRDESPRLVRRLDRGRWRALRRALKKISAAESVPPAGAEAVVGTGVQGGSQIGMETRVETGTEASAPPSRTPTAEADGSKSPTGSGPR